MNASWIRWLVLKRSLNISPLIIQQSRLLANIAPKFKAPTFVNKLGYMVGMVDLKYSPNRLHLSGQNMLAICAEYPDIDAFVNKLNMPDNFQSWFSITTLHIWLCLVRLRLEGEEGQILKEAVVQLLWEDLNARMRAFNILRKRHKQVLQSKVIFTGALLAYDEGLLANSDALLAGAVWRNLLLADENASAEQLEIAVSYIRRNLSHLFSIPSNVIVGKGTPDFYELGHDKFSRNKAAERVRYCLTWPDWAK